MTREFDGDTWGVWCTVSGGITGYRCAWLKQKDGTEARFTQDEAKAEAARLNKRADAMPYRAADFLYSAKVLN
jgi:hypothetical protein